MEIDKVVLPAEPVCGELGHEVVILGPPTVAHGEYCVRCTLAWRSGERREEGLGDERVREVRGV